MSDIVPSIVDPSKPHICPLGKNPITCDCPTCERAKAFASSQASLARAYARSVLPPRILSAPEPTAPRETTRQKYERQRRERYEQLEKTTAYLKAEYSTPKEKESFMLGWCLVGKTEPQEIMWSNLFTGETPKDKLDLVKQHNTHLNSIVRQGEIVVIPTMEAITEKDKKAVSDLQEDAKAGSVELAKLEPNEAETASRHFELFDYYASASGGVGAVASGVGQHLKNINNILLEVNNLYVSQVAMSSRTGGMGMNYGSFVAERTALLSKLDGSFAMLSSRSINIPAYVQVRKSLKLSTKSVIHHADEIIKNGWVPNLGQRMAKVAMGVSGTKAVGHVGLGLAAASGIEKIYDACSVDGTGECGKTTTKEVASFLGSLGGGAVGGNVAVILALGVVGAASAPVIAVATVSAFVVGGAVGGNYGGEVSGELAEFVYEWVENIL